MAINYDQQTSNCSTMDHVEVGLDEIHLRLYKRYKSYKSNLYLKQLFAVRWSKQTNQGKIYCKKQNNKEECVKALLQGAISIFLQLLHHVKQVIARQVCCCNQLYKIHFGYFSHNYRNLLVFMQPNNILQRFVLFVSQYLIPFPNYASK